MGDAEGKKRGRPRRMEPHHCRHMCGYSTFDRSNMGRHEVVCKKNSVMIISKESLQGVVGGRALRGSANE